MTINDLLNNEYVLMFIIAVLIVTPIIAIPKWLLMKENENNNIYGNNDNSEVKNKKVKVIDKRTALHPFDRTITINFVVFEFENSERVELAIQDNDIYNTIIKGDEGILTHKGKKFLRFERVKIK